MPAPGAARRSSDARAGTAAPPNKADVVAIGSLEEGLAAAARAAETGRPLILLGVSGPAGAGWWQALVAAVSAAHPTLDVTGIFDCGDHAGRAMAALRAGVRDVLFAGPEPAAGRLADLAAQSGARLWRHRPG